MAFCLVSEEMAKAGVGMTHNGHFQTGKMLIEYGTRKQQEKYLAKLLSGEYLAATAISEATVGSSFATMQTTVEKHHNAFVLNGVKTLINLCPFPYQGEGVGVAHPLLVLLITLR